MGQTEDEAKVREAMARLRWYASWWKCDGDLGDKDVALADEAEQALDRLLPTQLELWDGGIKGGAGG